VTNTPLEGPASDRQTHTRKGLSSQGGLRGAVESEGVESDCPTIPTPLWPGPEQLEVA
jgi:hypothetical protein